MAEQYDYVEATDLAVRQASVENLAEVARLLAINEQLVALLEQVAHVIEVDSLGQYSILADDIAAALE